MAKLKIETKAVTPRQWGMIAVLATALLGAIYWPADDAPTLDAGAEAGDAALRSSVAERLAALRSKTLPAVKKWPQVDLEAALRHDPFSSPLLASQNATTETETDAAANQRDQVVDLLALKQDGVSIVLQDDAGMVATVGGLKLHVGDVIDGYRVVAIEMDGVVLERVKTE